MYMTKHAEQRRIQRNIPMDVVEAIFAYGSTRHARGVVSLTFTRDSIELACDGDLRLKNRFERYDQTYIIVGEDDKIVTAARSKRRFRN